MKPLRFLFIVTFFIAICSLSAQDPNLIDVASLDQLDAMRYDLDGDGAVEVTTDASPSGNIDALEPLSAYATQFPGGAYYTRDAGTDTEVADAAVAAVASTTYVYKLPAPASGSYTGYELTEHLDFNGTKWGSDCTSGCLEADGGEAGTEASVGWLPIGDNTNQFLGTFDGNGHTISNIFIDRDITYVGLFGAIGGEVRNLGIEGGSVKGRHTGPLAGVVRGTVRVCYATANAEGAHTSTIYVGGLVGFLDGGTLASCYATGTVSSAAASRFSYCGSLLGGIAGTASSSNCYATGTATAEGETTTAGGLIGRGDVGSITACYATGDATATSRKGGLVGAFDSDNFMITGSYFDSDVSNRPSTDEGAQSTTVLQSTLDYTFIFEAWDTQEQWGGGSQYVWDLCSGDQYPKLSVDFDGDGTPSVGEFGAQGPCTSSFARIIDLETAGTAQDTKITELETGQTEQGTKLTELETAGAAQDTKITALETAKTELETAGAAQDTKITALETAKTELEMGQTTHGTKLTELETAGAAQDTKLTELETAQAALQAKIAAFEAALTAAGVNIPDPPTGGTPGGGGGNPGGGTTPPTGGTPGTTPPTGTPPTTTTIYSVPTPLGSPQAYPNPAQHTLLFANLTPGSRYVYKIYTAAGNFLTSGTVQDDKAINISALESGQYLLTLQDNNREVLRTSLLVEGKR